MFSKKSPTSNLSFIANDCELTGNIKVAGDVLIAGKINGEIRASGNVTVEPSGVITGGVVCVEATVSGLINGNITCEKLSITNTGTFDGEVYSKRMEILDNGQFIGYRKAYDESLEYKSLLNEKVVSPEADKSTDNPQLSAVNA
ncbi:polymer-forming cytoskeletal protein [Shewanella electrodiphila]|uniref:Polymer-forming cytoskeletal protein n=1 Tax=Shewanella electrodiphila TaxID=934143 RepID=A0ABT0KKC5_9GAMM|nr:polymer-forming cytoskeletal protein [Shewanella electrodiphila]MCL1044287.1 polymer-forming cytoskeletal protein [Shewanella electrodiphila]